MTASATWTPRPGDPTPSAYRTEVVRYKPENEGREYEYLPNVVCLSITSREGAEPQSARFRYTLDERFRSIGWPTQFETIIRLSQKAPAAGDQKPEKAEKYVVKPDARIVVLGYGEGDEEPEVLFDGFARAPQADVSGSGQVVTFDAAGVAVRLFDEPIHQILLRDAGKSTSAEDDDNRWTPLRARFNPDHRAMGLSIVTGNCTPDGSDLQVDVGDDDAPPDPSAVGHPAFVDPTYQRTPDDSGSPTYWTLDKFARYLAWAHNPDQEFVENPDPVMIKKLLDGRRPIKDAEYYDPRKPIKYQSSPIVLAEKDASGKHWPEALNEALVHNGFAMCFRTEADEKGLPWTTLELYRKDGSGPYAPKKVPYQQAYSDLDANLTQVGAMSLARDFGSVFNGVVVDTTPKLWEISVVLTLTHPIAAADATSANLTQFRATNLVNASPQMKDKYRLWVCEEVRGPTVTRSGAGYSIGATTNDKVLDCFDIWGGRPDDASAKETRRRRPGRKDLISRDAAGKAKDSYVSLSRDYDGPVNALWDGSGTWQDISGNKGWRLCVDRLGIRIDIEDPNAWDIGSKTGAVVGSSGIVKLVVATAAPNTYNPTLFLRLTTVIEGDERVSKPLPRRKTSPLKRTRYRMVDGRESYRTEAVHKSSPNFGLADTKGKLNDAFDAILVRDDAEKVAAYAAQVQQAYDDPPIVGTITIPFFSDAYRVGDQISDVSGRDLSLLVNAGVEQGEAPRYPYVVGVDWTFSPNQATVLHLSDRIATPAEQGAIL